jgi:hypothetical protein
MKITPKQKVERTSITMRTKAKNPNENNAFFRWWETKEENQLADQLCSTVAYLKQGQNFRQRQAALHARLYGNQSLFSFVGSNMSKLDTYADLPPDRPTFNLVSSVVDTLISKLTQSRPAPVFLTDNSDYKERNLAKKLNNFILGEFYQTKAYELGEFVLRDALVFGTGCVKIIETQDKKVGLDRVLPIELFVDLNESAYDDPRSLYQVKLIDREVLEGMFPKEDKIITEAMRATIDDTGQSYKTVSDLVMVVEGWHLPSAEGAGDGRHAIACSSGLLFEEEWKKGKFPFVFLHHKRRTLGFWSQGTAESLTGTQLELNSLLSTISRSIKLVGVPRLLAERGSKFNKGSAGNTIAEIWEYSGTQPIPLDWKANQMEMYQERDRIIQYGYQQEGLSSLSATSQKPQGLDSGEAIRTYDNINTDRFASTSRRYDNFYIDLAYQIVDKAKDIAEREGKYQTIYPDKKGTKEIDLPKLSLLSDPFVIQCFNESSLPRDPAGRKQTIIEMIQSGMLSIKEGRRLLNYPDLEQIETLASASEERIFCYLDEIVEEGKYTPPDVFMDLGLAMELTIQYINLYTCRKLEESKCQLLRDFFSQVQDLLAAANPPPQPQTNSPQAVPQPPPVSPVLPNSPAQQS